MLSIVRLGWGCPLLPITRKQARYIIKKYNWKVYRGHPIHGGFLLETNKGMKQISIWDSELIFKWSHLWREAFAQNGYRPVQRFLPTKDNKPYFDFKNRVISVSDYYTGKNPDYRRERDNFVLGRGLGRLHRIFFELQDHPLVKQVNKKWREEKRCEVINQQTVEEALRELRLYEASVNTYSLRLRFQRALVFFHQSSSIRDKLPLSHDFYSHKNFVRTAGSWFLTGFHNPSLQLLHHDTCFVIRDIFKKSEWNLKMVSSFFKGYLKERHLGLEEWVYILAILIYPGEIWEALQRKDWNYLKSLLDEQNKWDKLSSWIAGELDRRSEVPTS